MQISPEKEQKRKNKRVNSISIISGATYRKIGRTGNNSN